MHNVSIVFAALLSVGSVCCVAVPDVAPAPVADAPAAELSAAPEANGGLGTVPYYVVTRPDLRKCAFPMCGGYYVKRVNQSQTICADGVMQADCHVAALDVSNLDLEDADASKFELVFGSGHGIVRAGLGQVETEAGLVDTLMATEAWVAEAITKPTGDFYLATGTGVRCWTTPCPSYKEQKLNVGTLQNLADVDLAASGANSKQVGLGMDELETQGILVAGTHRTVTGPAGSMQKLVASEFYLRLQPSRSATGR